MTRDITTIASQVGLDLTRDNTMRADVATDTLDNEELKAALTSASRRGGLFDILAFEACLENTIEVAYQVRKTAHFIVGSQSNIPAPGWMFTPILKAMQDQKLPTRDLVMFMVDNAITQIDDDESAAISGLDLSKADLLAEAVSVLAETMMAAMDDTGLFLAISRAHYAAQAFADSETVDLVDFCDELMTRTDCAAILNAAAAVKQAAREFVVRAKPRGVVVENAHGISIFFPRRDHISDSYRQLDFAQETSWTDFLDAYLERLFPPPVDPFESNAGEPASDLAPAAMLDELVGAGA